MLKLPISKNKTEAYRRLLNICSCFPNPSTFHGFLVVLACFDLGYLVVFALNVGLNPHDADMAYSEPQPRVWVLLYPKFLHPMQQTFQSASIYMTMAICINR